MPHHRYIITVDVTVAEVPAPPPAASASTGIGNELAQDLSTQVKPLKLKKPSNQKNYAIDAVAVTKVVPAP